MFIKIANKPYFIVCSQPYTLGKNQPYQVNKFIGGRKSAKVVETFEDKSSADEYRKQFNEKWIVTFCTIDGEEVSDIEIFNTEKEAMNFYEENMKQNSEHVKQNIEDEDDRLIDMLESSIYSMSNIPQEIADGLDEEERLRLIEAEKADSEYDENVKFAIDRANNLLKSVSELYLDKKTIEKHEFIMNKLMFEQQSISSIALQIAILNRILKKSYKEVIKNPHPKNIESMVKLQKMILDLSKYQREYIDSVQESFKSLKKDADDELFAKGEMEDIEVVDVTSQEGFFSTNSRIELTKKLMAFREESKMKIPLSPNAKLVAGKNDPRLEKEAKIYTPVDISVENGHEDDPEDDGLSSSLKY